MAQKGTGNYSYRRLRAAFLAQHPSVRGVVALRPRWTTSSRTLAGINDVSRGARVPLMQQQMNAQYGHAKRRALAAQSERRRITRPVVSGAKQRECLHTEDFF
jgi:hypothetical protein